MIIHREFIHYKMVIFHSYVKLPEGIPNIWYFRYQTYSNIKFLDMKRKQSYLHKVLTQQYQRNYYSQNGLGYFYPEIDLSVHPEIDL